MAKSMRRSYDTVIKKQGGNGANKSLDYFKIVFRHQILDKIC